MKKYILLGAFIASLLIGACSPYTDEEPGGTAVQDLCGTWVVTPFASVGEYIGNLDLSLMTKTELDAVDDWAYAGDMFALRTYNTANNDKDSLWFDDGFWHEKFKIHCDYGKLAFGSENDSVDAISADGCKALIRFGQVIKGAVTTPRGQKADSIIAYVFYNDDEDGLTYKFSGYRYTGYSEDLE